MKKAFLYFEIFAGIALLLMALGDLLFFVFGGAGQTLSYQFWELAKQYPVVPFAFGFLSGHLVWQFDPDFVKPVQKK